MFHRRWQLWVRGQLGERFWSTNGRNESWAKRGRSLDCQRSMAGTMSPVQSGAELLQGDAGEQWLAGKATGQWQPDAPSGNADVSPPARR